MQGIISGVVLVAVFAAAAAAGIVAAVRLYRGARPAGAPAPGDPPAGQKAREDAHG